MAVATVMTMTSFHRVRQARNGEVSSGDDRHRRAQGIALERGIQIKKAANG
jgi:hypothetical protein